MIIKNLVKRYGKKTVVKDISVELPKQKITAFIGPNGAGKSTVMNIISRLIARDSGTVLFKDQDVAKWKSRELAKHLAILTQSNNISMKLTVEELVSFGRFPYSGNRLTPEDRNIVGNALDYMEMTKMKHMFLDELSGGQQQRAYIAMVIAQDTEYVLLDEPINNLDVYHASKMMKLVQKLCHDLKKTVFIVIHDINYASFYADYICAFVDGEIAKFGPVEEVMTADFLAQTYSTPFTTQDYNGKRLCVYY